MIWYRTPQHARTATRLLSPIPYSVKARAVTAQHQAGIHALATRTQQPGIAAVAATRAPSVSAPRSSGSKGR